MPYNRTGAMRALHFTGKNLGLDHNGLRDVAASIFRIPSGKVSLGKLSDNQLAQLLGHLKGETPGAPIAMPNAASDRQIWKIHQLEAELGWRDEPQRLAGFIARQCRGKNNLRDLTVRDAQLVIDGLKNLLAHSTTPAE